MREAVISMRSAYGRSGRTSGRLGSASFARSGQAPRGPTKGQVCCSSLWVKSGSGGITAISPLHALAAVGFRGGITALDTATVSIRFDNGSLGTISGVCPCEYGYDARVEIVGEKGIMQIGEMNGRALVIGVDRDKGLVTPIHRTWPERFAWGYIREMEHFIDCIRGGAEPHASGTDGRWAVAGVLAGTKSFQEERLVHLSEVLN